MDKNSRAFFALLKAGLWEQSVCLLPYSPLNFDALYQMADEQSVVGLIAAGLEHVTDMKVTKPQAIPFLKKVFSLEARNTAMNGFIGDLVSRLRGEGIDTLLVKGQGIARCYERPQWRASGDVDLFLNNENYEKAKAFLIPVAESVDKEDPARKHLGMKIESWSVELHGTLRGPLLKRINPMIDEVQKDLFENNRFRVWRNGEKDIYLPSPDSDVIFTFTHILQHYFGAGIGLRQICDWCRLLWTYHDEIDHSLLKKRLTAMQLLTEWQVFCAYAVHYLGAPPDVMPLYNPNRRWIWKAGMVNSLILDYGNFGQGRDLSYYKTRPYLVRKAISFKYRFFDAIRNILIFPKDSLLAFSQTFRRGLLAASKGE
jgi:hypothetical protein